MKRQLLSVLFLAIGFCAKAAFPPGTYDFTQFNAPYTSLSNGTLVKQGYFGSFTDFIGQCNFFDPWEYFGFSTTRTNAPSVSSDRSRITVPLTHSPVGDVFAAYPLGVTITLSATGPHIGIISCKLEGSWPNRIYKVQFDSVLTMEESPTIESTISYQIWFYESDHAIEFRYGPRNITPGHIFGFNGIFCGLAYDIGGSGTEVAATLQGDPNNPTLTNTTFQFTPGLNSVPPENKVYRFAPSPLGVVNTMSENDLKISFDPTVRKAILTYPDNAAPSEIELLTITGQKMPVVYDRLQNRSEVSFINVSPGIYTLLVRSEKGIYRQKIIIP